MHRPTDDWYTGPVEQIIPAPPGWLLAVLVKTEERLLVELHPIMCWARTEARYAPENSVLPVIQIAGAGQPYIGECVLIAPGQDVTEQLAAGLGLRDPADYVIDTASWRPEHLARLGWRSDAPAQVRVTGC